MEVEDIEDLVEYVKVELNNEYLIEMEMQQHLEEEEEEKVEEVQSVLYINFIRKKCLIVFLCSVLCKRCNLKLNYQVEMSFRPFNYFCMAKMV